MCNIFLVLADIAVPYVLTTLSKLPQVGDRFVLTDEQRILMIKTAAEYRKDAEEYTSDVSYNIGATSEGGGDFIEKAITFSGEELSSMDKVLSYLSNVNTCYFVKHLIPDIGYVVIERRANI